MTVSAIIPTTGRNSVGRSVKAALLQSSISEVIIVADGREAGAKTEHALHNLSESNDARIRLHVALNAGNGSKVRNVGTRLAQNPFVAYCDDDDVWLPDKIQRQLENIAPKQSTFSSHAYWRVARNSNKIMPNKPFDEKELGSLLLTRDSLRYRRGFCATTTLLVPTRAALDVAWDEKLRRHQDWDFVLRLKREQNLKLIFLDQPMAVIDATTSSVSRQVIDTQPAEYFILKHQDYLNEKALADFAAVHIAGVHFRNGRYTEGFKSLKSTFETHGSPSQAAIVLALLRSAQHLRSFIQ